MAKQVLAFDVYGTLINTHGVAEALETMVGDQAMPFSQAWRDKQLEYSFRRGLMQNYVDFSICTRNALDYTCSVLKQELSESQRLDLMAAYRTLPAFDDVHEALRSLKESDIELYAFSNGNQEAVETLLKTAGIRDYFSGVVSVDDMKSFKPNPGVYSHFLRQANATGQDAWLISSNPFDVIGAVSAGMRATWVQRSPEAIFDPWGIEPTVTINSLSQLKEALKAD